MADLRRASEINDDILYGGVGSGQVVAKEFEHIRSWRGIEGDPQVGLALSGGGIRSASYCLGVLQALAHERALPQFDYLSSVSGGGYTGASLSYLLHASAKDLKDRGADEMHKFDTSHVNFPYVSYPMVGAQAPGGRHEVEWRMKGLLLRRLRQSASYLTPGNGITLLSLVGVLLRNLGASVFVHVALMVLVLQALLGVNALPPAMPVSAIATSNVDWPQSNPLLWLAGLAVVAYAALSLLYVVSTRLFDRLESIGGWRNTPYRIRRLYDRVVNVMFTFAIAMLVLGVLPWLQALLASSKFMNLGTWLDILGSATNDKPATTGTVAAIVGIAGNVWALVQARSDKKPRVPTTLIVWVASILLLLGVLLLVFVLTSSLHEHHGWTLAGVALGVLLGLGLLPEANYVSLHRFYRDRLMEIFLPDLQQLRESASSRDAESGIGATRPGDTAMLGELCRSPATTDTAEVAEKRLRGPYHIINANVVLVASKQPRYRGRGGDNFVLSPLFCGSRATTWQCTESSPERGFTLATAMAISGAALNPNAGPGGEGITRQPALSVLMGMMNLRLGYWADNPRYESPSLLRPNLLWPGLAESFGRKNLHEHARFVLLTDGGHFENLGLYELVRRRLKLIVVCDATADPDYEFTDLANAIEKIRADFGAIVYDLGARELAHLVPTARDGAQQPIAERGHLVARIQYSLRPGQPPHAKPDEGLLVVLKSTFFASLTADLYGYRGAHRSFPNQSTGDQFFDEKEFEAYRELGFQTAYAMLGELKVGEADAKPGPARRMAAELLWG